MSARLDLDRMDNTAGTGFYRDQNGDLKRGTNVPDAMWLRTKKFKFVGCAVMEEGDEEPAIRSLIAQNKALGDDEIVTWLEGKLEETKQNKWAAEKTRREAPQVVKTEEEQRLASFAGAIVQETVSQIEDRAEKRRSANAARPAPASP